MSTDFAGLKLQQVRAFVHHIAVMRPDDAAHHAHQGLVQHAVVVGQQHRVHMPGIERLGHAVEHVTAGLLVGHCDLVHRERRVGLETDAVRLAALELLVDAR